MYHPVEVEVLSNAQLSKLLKGHPVRVKSGKGHVIHLSTEQAKKHHKASLKGAGHNLTLDPYQMAHHAHLHGTGIMSKLKKVGKMVKHNPLLNSLAHQAISGASDFASSHGLDASMVSDMAHDRLGGGSLKSFTKGVRKFAKNPLVQQIGKMALNEATGGLSSMAGLGLVSHATHGGSLKSFSRGVRKIAKNPLVQQIGKMALNEATGGLSGMGGFNIHGLGIKKTKKRVGRPRGGALLAAGYGY